MTEEYRIDCPFGRGSVLSNSASACPPHFLNQRERMLKPP
jgi:hypothetical protein